MTKRILYVVSGLDGHGAEQQLALLAARLPRAEFDVQFCCLMPSDSADGSRLAPGTAVTNLGQRWSFDPLAAWRFRRLLRHWRPDLIHISRLSPGGYAALALSDGQFPLVASDLPIGQRSPWQRFMIARLTSKTRAIVAPCASARDALVQQGWPVENLVIIPPAAAPGGNGRLTRGALLAQLGLPDHAHLIGIVGRLEIEEGWKEVIWSLDILRCLRDDLHLLVVGEGRQRAQLERFARLCTLAPNVHFLGHRTDVAELFPHFNHLWQAKGSGGGSAAIDSLAAGVPVVASDTPSNRELVIHDQTGFLVPCGDRAGRARYANRLINDLALRARLGDAGRQRMATLFNLDQMVARHVDLYHRVLQA